MKDNTVLEICGKTIHPGESVHFNLSSYRLPISDMLDTPVYVFRSLKPGPIVLLQGGMHGNETNGVEIVRQLVSRHGIKNPLKGTIIAIPILNIAGFIAGTRDLPDGRDLSAEMVKLGMAVDWPKFSGGKYRQYELPESRRLLWRCDARQKGRMPPPTPR